MTFLQSFAKLIGSAAETGWAQFYEFSPDGPSQQVKGRLFVLISGSGKGASINTFTAAREVVSDIHHRYYEDKEAKPYSALERAVKRSYESFSKSISKLQVAALSLSDKYVYTSAAAGGVVDVYRKNMFANILRSDSDKVVSASGSAMNDDLLVLSTSKVAEIFSQEQLAGALVLGDPESVIGALGTNLGYNKPPGNLGLVVIKLSERVGDAGSTKRSEVKSGRFTKSIIGKLTSLSSNFPKKQVRVRSDMAVGESGTEKRKTLSIGSILLVLLIVSIAFGVVQKSTKDQKEAYSARLTQAEHEYEEAVNLFSLNPERARELFASSQLVADDLMAQGVKDERLENLIGKIDKSKQLVLGEYRSEMNLFLDLSLLSNDFDATQMSATTDRLLVLDDKGNKAVSVVISTKNTETAAGPEEIEGVESVVVSENANYGVTPAAVFELGDSEVVVPRDWGGDITPIVYAGNLYVIDTTEQTIWRYPGVQSGFGGRSNWFSSTVDEDLTSVVSWTIDGSIWLLRDGGRVDKYLGGAPREFSMSGVTGSTDAIAGIYTNDELEYLYLLDKGGDRILVLTKEGEYRAQYSADLSQVVDFVVSESERQIIFLTKNKLFSVELKHL